jgi:hypothetical protein
MLTGSREEVVYLVISWSHFPSAPSLPAGRLWRGERAGAWRSVLATMQLRGNFRCPRAATLQLTKQHVHTLDEVSDWVSESFGVAVSIWMEN